MTRPWRTADVTLGGMMAGLAALMQAAPVYWPGPGYLLAALGSLPMAVLALRSPRAAPLSALATILLLMMVHVEEAVVFSLTTGPLGLAIGYGRRAALPRLAATLLATGPLLAGMFGLTHLVGLPPLGPWPVRNALVETTVYGLFAFAYSAVWVWLFDRFSRRLAGVTPCH